MEFGALSSFCSQNSSRLSDNYDILDQEEALGGAPPPQEEDTRQKNNEQPVHKSDSASNLTAPLAEVYVKLFYLYYIPILLFNITLSILYNETICMQIS